MLIFTRLSSFKHTHTQDIVHMGDSFWIVGNLTVLVTIVTKQISLYGQKYLCSTTEKKKEISFGITWGRVNDDMIFGWTFNPRVVPNLYAERRTKLKQNTIKQSKLNY